MVCHGTIFTSKHPLKALCNFIPEHQNFLNFLRCSIVKPKHLKLQNTITKSGDDKQYITSFKRAQKFRMKNETPHSSQIMKICYKFHTVSGKSIKHKLTYFTDFLLAAQRLGMHSSRSRRTRTGLDYSSSTAPREVLLTHVEVWVSTDTSTTSKMMCSLMSL